MSITVSKFVVKQSDLLQSKGLLRRSCRAFTCNAKRAAEIDTRAASAAVKWDLKEKISDVADIASPNWNDFCNLTSGQWGGKYANYDPTTGEIIPVQVNSWKEDVFELSSITVEESSENDEQAELGSLMRINITGNVDEARWRQKGSEETFREEKFLNMDQMTIYANGSYSITPKTLQPEKQQGEDEETERSKPAKLQPIDLEHTINLENNQRVRILVTLLFNKPDIEVIRLGLYKEKQVTAKQAVHVFDPTWCINDQESIKKEKYSSELWDAQEIEVLVDGKYQESQGVYQIQFSPEAEAEESKESSGVTYWLPNYCSVTFDQQDDVMTISTFALDHRKNIQFGLETKYDTDGNKISTKFTRAVSNVRPDEGFVLRL
eukprot:TRINITY_DN2515_c0_g2_i1.p1 TRINITY_DN2515_c0_g2~~TRINITY_DN2515_c0_g2_i1.p1  ORF type:complete len:421 (-),score=68.65 TRINITY_DN2515_c0_g2_i1:311-1444(-)